MNFDLLAFDPKRAPRLRSAFLSWYQAGTQLGAEHDYNSPAALTPLLRSFYDQIRQQFPPRNGPDAIVSSELLLRPPSGLWQRLTGRASPLDGEAERPPGRRAHYSFAENFILMSFLRDEAEAAYRAVLSTAHDCGAGFYNAASDLGEILHDAEQFHPFLLAARRPG